MTIEEARAKYPNLIEAVAWVGHLSRSSAAMLLAYHKRGDTYGSEAVWHYGGHHKLLKEATTDWRRAHVRRMLGGLRG